MSKDIEKRANQYQYTQNRELSWLRFNQRVLEEAGDEETPLLERIKFVAIFSSNLDEFFMVRVGSLFDLSLVSPKEIDNKSGMSPEEQIQKIYNTIPGLIKQKNQIYFKIMSELDYHGIKDLSFNELSASEQKFVNQYFQTRILPILSPIIIGHYHPIPHLINKSLHISSLLKDKKGRSAIGFIPVPDSLPPYIRLPGNEFRYIRTENIILQWAPVLFGSYKVKESCVLSITRNADISFDMEKLEDREDNIKSIMKKLLKKRDYLAIVRLEISCPLSEDFSELLFSTINVEKRQVYIDSCPLIMKYVFEMASELPESKAAPLLYTPYESRWPEDISHDQSMIEQIRNKDRLLFYPFDSVEPFLRLLSEAAERPDVLSIKITIYRLASSSRIAQILARAAENGKEVIVLMELRARFDEENNISWSNMLESAGCQVIYGMADFKCHSKICLITLKGRGNMNYITQVGTGNYNESTNAMYTDLSIMTASQEIGEDGAAFFRNMLVNNLDGDYKQLLVAPNKMKTNLCDLIDKQIKKGREGYICIKANSITERTIIDKLMEASRAGVEIQLIIRGICCILPGIPEYTDNIQVSSIVGRYLEHARIYCFGKGEESEYFISSADLMTRNLNRRVEIACPVFDRDLCDQLRWILDIQLQDNVKASFVMSDGVYVRKESTSALSCNSQNHFMEFSSHKEPVPEAVSIPFSEKVACFFKNLFYK
ncbi:MAG TPA: polyphosphate kinase 1 [Mogibacterium sp.]|nr:polyphosphate kinase 1 [Mogibacterium sp.]